MPTSPTEIAHWIMGGLATLFLGLLGWMAVQLYALEPLRVAAASAPPTPPPAAHRAP